VRRLREEVDARVEAERQRIAQLEKLETERRRAAEEAAAERGWLGKEGAEGRQLVARGRRGLLKKAREAAGAGAAGAERGVVGGGGVGGGVVGGSAEEEAAAEERRPQLEAQELERRRQMEAEAAWLRGRNGRRKMERDQRKKGMKEQAQAKTKGAGGGGGGAVAAAAAAEGGGAVVAAAKKKKQQQTRKQEQEQEQELKDEAAWLLEGAPPDLICPLSGVLMTEPRWAGDGRTCAWGVVACLVLIGLIDVGRVDLCSS
jgi:hypothetical protein